MGGRFAHAFRLEHQFAPQLHALGGVVLNPGQVQQVHAGQRGHDMLGVALQHQPVSLLGLLVLAHLFVRVADQVAGGGRLGRVGPVVDHGLKTVLDGRVGLAELQLAQAPLQLGVQATSLSSCSERNLSYSVRATFHWLSRKYFSAMFIW